MSMNTATVATTEDKPLRRVPLDIDGMVITVSAEDVVRLFLDRLRASTAPQVVRVPSIRIGAPWPEHGGIYAGIVRGAEGEPDHHLILAEEAHEALPWSDAMAWAKSLTIDGHNDYTLPKRKEQAVLFGQVPERFEKEWYWSCEEHSNTAYAWCQYFDHGSQHDYYKGDFYRARAVRRISIK